MDRQRLSARITRRKRARRAGPPTPLLGLGMFGLVGWSVAVPTLAAVALGVWLERRWPGPPSWTLMLLAIGIAVGCGNAWYWVKRANADLAEVDNDDENDDENGDLM